MEKILDAKHEKADFPAIIRENCSHLTATEWEKLLSVQLKFEPLFNGTLGDWKLPPVSFELKEGMQPYHGRPYPIPRKIKWLCDIGVLEWQPSSRWPSPTFIIPKMDSTVRSISDFRELNKHIVRKPFPIPQISKILLELEPQPLILTWATTAPSGWTQQHPRYVQSYFLGESTHTRDFPWALEAQPTYSKLK